MTITPWPPMHAYALAHRCPTCKAEPGQPCDAPHKQAGIAQLTELRTAAGLETVTDPSLVLHAPRIGAGNRHYRRDVARAPWEEEREPGRRYDTLGDAWTSPDEPAAP
jgi:hypothetical protein